MEVFARQPGETAEGAARRIFAEKTEPAVGARCVLAPAVSTPPLPAGVQRFGFVPDAAYRRALDAKADPDEVPEPACGDWGDMPDGLQYFEAPRGDVPSLLFVRLREGDGLVAAQTVQLNPPEPRVAAAPLAGTRPEGLAGRTTPACSPTADPAGTGMHPRPTRPLKEPTP